MHTMVYIAKVAVSAAVVSIDKAYDYRVPPAMEQEARRGRRCMVPFGRGNKLTEGVIVEVAQQPECPPRLKALAHVFGETISLDEEGLALAGYIRQRYFCTFFEAANLLIPPGVWSQKTYYRLAAGLDEGELEKRCGGDGDALAVCLAIAAQKGRIKYLWIIALPLAFDVVVTVTGSWMKIFSSDPKVGYWANYSAAKKALDSGAEKFGTAKSPAEIEAVVRNTFVQGTLSVLFVVLTLIVVVAALIVTIRAINGKRGRDHEDPFVESAFYAPAGLVATPAERALEKEWSDYRSRAKEPASAGASER